MNHAVGAIRRHLGARGTENDALLPVVPMFHANSWGLPYAAGMAGSKMVFPAVSPPMPIARRAGGAGERDLSRRRADRLACPGELPEGERQAAPKVRTVVCGGSRFPLADGGHDALGLPILHAWGMTETSPLGSVARVAAAPSLKTS